MTFNEYETIIVTKPELSGEIIEATLDRIRDVINKGEGKLLSINHWGKRKLAYPVKKQSRGIYIHTQYLSPGGVVRELERNLRIADTVLRYLTVKLDSKVDPETKHAQAYVAPKYDFDNENESPLNRDETSSSEDSPATEEGTIETKQDLAAEESLESDEETTTTEDAVDADADKEKETEVASSDDEQSESV